jgi:glucosamine--fructose-6-phosphate aminotransferase (isomerizing)
MCGIVGGVSARNIVPVLIAGLKRLEYRGYDSAGLAVLQPQLTRVRSVGRVAELESQVGSLQGSTGIAHTRWATHGRPAEHNAHPHASGHLALVHNGIIENHEAIRARLTARGYVFASETDTEVVAHLLHDLMNRGMGLFDALTAATAELQGAYAIAAISEREPATVAGVRRGAPLLIGVSDDEYFLASDASALVEQTQRVVYLDEGDCVELGLRGYRIRDAHGAIVQRPIHVSQVSRDAVDLGPYRHFMQKEIFEQPGAVSATLEMVANAQSLTANLFGSKAEEILRETRQVLILACGTSYHAALVARYWLEAVAAVPCSVEIASEYRYRDSVALPDTLVITISQSGETADTLAALEFARSRGHRHSLTICNVPESSIMRRSELRFLTRAGPEIGVASTKAFTTQLAALFVLVLVLARLNGRLTGTRERELLEQLRHLPAALNKVLACEEAVAGWARLFAARSHALFLGRGVHYPIALEGALKLKEITYIHAEAYAAGELKHGPLALVDRDMPVVAVAPNDALLEKLKSNLQEVRARGGELFVFADDDAHIEASEGVQVIKLVDHAGLLSPILHVVPLQLLAYHTALVRGTDVDKPRNLAKSVTVE